MRLTRLIIGFLVILVAILIIAGEQLSGASTDAVINARTTTVRAPIAGRLALERRQLGSAVSSDEVLGLIRDQLVETGRLNDLQRERADVQAEIGRLEQLSDSLSDLSELDERRMELEPRLFEIRASLEAERARLSAYDNRISAERLSLNRLAGANLAANVDGIVWEVLAGDGEIVQRGQDLLRLIDCKSTLVTLSVSESVYNRLSTGDDARFRLNGDGRTFDATVTRLAGSGAQGVYRNLAIAPGQRHLERYDVTLLVPALRQDSKLGCAVGRTGRVFFETRPLDFLRRVWE
ncbi:MAG: HlyD family efflux transporter periplasmic adaptor subunit [Rhizobiaceae bacterium]|nr:HlyD family efflux transporter periplasmic adaptor subunit [Rhizobiaceae bacterium]MCV0405291.1 HlyD family efflux transporter periplasmic adaptor subunit [Rhizobiaceae bacterium]